MLKRKIEKEITKWIKDDKRALLVYGVRQAGKTFSIRECLKESGVPYVEFNLIYEPDVLDILKNSKGVDDIILRLSLYTKDKLVPNKTIIFFDEIQEYKEIATMIKSLVDDGRFRYVLSGSLLGVEINNIRSAPVGYLKTLKMYPLDLEEFIQIFNIDDKVIDLLRRSYEDMTKVDDVIHERMLQIFNLYLLIGGMPSAIEVYRNTNDIDLVMDEHRDIIALYKLDFTKYEKEDKKLRLIDTYDLIPIELNKENKRFKISDLRRDLRYEKVEDSFLWLDKAGVALPVYNVEEAMMPLLINKKRSLFKLFLSDVGMLTTIYGKATKLKIMNMDRDINKGAIYEDVVSQELCAHGFACYYYANKKLGEVDLVIEKGDKVLPIIVKSGKDYKRHSALNNLLYSGVSDIEEAIVFSLGNVEKEAKIKYLPIYMTMFLKEDDVDIDINIDKYMFD